MDKRLEAFQRLLNIMADTLGAVTSLLLFLMIRPDKRLGER